MSDWINHVKNLEADSLKRIKGICDEINTKIKHINQNLDDGTSPVVLISGPTGGGKTELAMSVTDIVGASTKINTDILREIWRGSKETESNIFNYLSSFEAWMPYVFYDCEHIIQRLRTGPCDEYPEGIAPFKKLTSWLESKACDDSKYILRGFTKQCRQVFPNTCATMYRAMFENHPTIIEGVHLVLNEIENSSVWNARRVYRVFVHCSDEEKHKALLEARASTGRDVMQNRYTRNWIAIREIGEFLRQKAEGHSDLLMDQVDLSKDEMAEQFKQSYDSWRKQAS